jgi:hypothetical protein
MYPGRRLTLCDVLEVQLESLCLENCHLGTAINVMRVQQVVGHVSTRTFVKESGFFVVDLRDHGVVLRLPELVDLGIGVSGVHGLLAKAYEIHAGGDGLFGHIEAKYGIAGHDTTGFDETASVHYHI